MKNKQLHVQIIQHACIANALWHLRNERTPLETFRRNSDTISKLLIAEAMRNLSLTTKKVQTPLTMTEAECLSEDIVVVPVLRAGLAMLFGVLELVPQTRIGFVGLERNEKTALAKEYYWKIPTITKNTVVMVVDPMVATGGSAIHVLKRLAEKKPKSLKLVSVISSTEGIKSVNDLFPDVQIFTAAVDEKLNSKKYIVPGLGDYGDRYFGTDYVTLTP